MGLIKKIHYNSPVILSFFLICLISLLLGYLTGGYSNYLVFSVYKSPFNDPLTYVRLIAHVFGHHSFGHFINNMMLILLVGPMVEEKYGSKKLLIMILITALCTGLIHMLFSTALLSGASGIVFFLILISSYANYQKGTIPLTLIFVFIIFMGQEVYNMIFVADSVSRITHIAGALIGSVSGAALNRNGN